MCVISWDVSLYNEMHALCVNVKYLNEYRDSNLVCFTMTLYDRSTICLLAVLDFLARRTEGNTPEHDREAEYEHHIFIVLCRFLLQL